MNFADFDKYQSILLSKVTAMGETKGKEYAHDADRFANFKRLATELEVSPSFIAWVLLKKHLDGIVSYIKTGKEYSEEGIQGRVVDAITYLTLIGGMFEEGKNTLTEVYSCLPSKPEPNRADCIICGKPTSTLNRLAGFDTNNDIAYRHLTCCPVPGTINPIKQIFLRGNYIGDDKAMITCIECGHIFLTGEDIKEIVNYQGEITGYRHAIICTQSNRSSIVASNMDKVHCIRCGILLRSKDEIITEPKGSAHYPSCPNVDVSICRECNKPIVIGEEVRRFVDHTGKVTDYYYHVKCTPVYTPDR